jgi:hypothetical protein
MMSSSNNFKFSFRIFGLEIRKTLWVLKHVQLGVWLVKFDRVWNGGDKIFYRMRMVTPPRRPLVR